MDVKTIQHIKAFVKLRLRRNLTVDEKLDILWLQATHREVNSANVTDVISQLLGRAPKTGKPKSTPKGTWKKSALYEACVQYQLQDVSPIDIKSTIWTTLKKHLDEHVPPVVVSMARSRGHHVVYAAPGFSDLQPIEMVWANVKARFSRVGLGVICNTIKSSTEKLLALHQVLRAVEEVEPICYDQASNSETSLNDDSSSSSESSGCENEG
ncbi:hypothetical protein H310_11771 [Aphanomyces invadans]|uniref:Tc1-like transposase DDE domain-containing protein n=1 Tax=Aphanomyces invadans TaxID=157072 RepID=A0A024TK94_9STRA|nr:hypothetical protein H310_11771 [Aphanomyces invadans]ETV94443.1 hypothetical protein H310_11771 [Aphanomyces invadans]|eukprot:XP_008876758.1 hypothetical protein H310_11771 [Aphanomyces invadans]